MTSRPRVGAIEAGGTKFRVAVAEGSEMVADATIPTTTPPETIPAVIEFLQTNGALAACGIAAFGPLDLDPTSPRYGWITNTPKPTWGDTPLLPPVAEAIGVPTAIDIDVGGAALAELRWGVAQGLHSAVYLTVGTGVGGGFVSDGRIRHGLGHPEMGHIPMAQIDGDDFRGVCPYHGSCLEGMAAGPALAARWGAPGAELRDRTEVWELEAEYLAQAARAITYMIAPQRIILGGGVLQQEGLLELVRAKTAKQLAGYVTSDDLRRSLDDYIVAPSFGQDAGLLGAVAMALDLTG